jgi:ABC-type multidrug transport system fused ATPase/permease subunit
VLSADAVQTISRAFEGSTVLIVAHRLATVLDCDRVLLLDGGRIVESGAPRELARDTTTRFHTLVNITSGREEAS